MGLNQRRLELHEILCGILGSRNVYYQQPNSTKMSYPAIIYSRDDIVNDFADNNVYIQSHRYQITVIDRNPDSEIVEKVSQMPKCRYDRHYVSDNLNHDIFTIYY